MIKKIKQKTSFYGSNNPVYVYYLLVFLEQLSFGLHATIYVLFLLSQNLNLFQVNVVNFVFMVSIFLFELPTGAFADLYGRKKSLILGYLILSFAFYIYFISYSFNMFLLAECIAAIGFTFISGAQEAWIADAVKKQKIQQNIDLVFSHGHIISRFASLLSGLVGAYIGTVSLRIPMELTSFFLFITAIFVFFFVQETYYKQKNLQENTSIKSLITTAKEGIRYASLHRVIMILIIISFLTSFAFQSPNMYWSPRFNELAGNQIWIVGWVWAGISLSMMFGSYLIKSLIKKEKSYTQICIAAMLCLGIPLFISAASNIFSIVLISFLLYEVGRGMHQPIQKGYLNNFLSPHHRATVFSFDSMIGKLGAAVGLLLMGLLAKNTSIQTAWVVSALLILSAIPLYILAGKKNHRS